jgi:hypothetical protein
MALRSTRSTPEEAWSGPPRAPLPRRPDPIPPWALATTFTGPALPAIRRIVAPSIGTTISLCVSEQQPMSEPARVVRDILEALVRDRLASGRCGGIRTPAAAVSTP